MNYVKCHVCENDNYELVERHLKDECLPPSFEVRTVICKICGFVYVNPQAPEDVLLKMYETYANTRTADPPKIYLDRKDYDAERKINWILANIPTPHKGKILDIGCASGNLLRAFRGRGWDVYGIEPTKSYAKFAREIYNLNVQEGFLEENKFPPSTFDLIVLAETLEHLTDPGWALRIIWRWLKPHGRFYLDVPNVLQPSRFRRASCFRGEHLNHFSPNTLQLIMRKHGFQIEACRAHAYQYAVARKSEPESRINFEHEGDSYKETLTAVRWRYPALIQARIEAGVKRLIVTVFRRRIGWRLVAQLAKCRDSIRSRSLR